MSISLGALVNLVRRSIFLLRKTPLSAEEQKEFAQLQSLVCSEDVFTPLED